MMVSKVGRRGQITLPKEIRRWLQLREGDHVVFRRKDEMVIVEPLTRTLFDLRGSVPVTEPQDFAAIRQQVLTVHAHEVATDAD